jgi:hypothetical protein
VTTPHVSNGLPRRIWAASIMLAALVVSSAVGILSWWGGLNGPHALVTAVTSFTGTTTFGLSVFDFLTGHR